MESEIQNRYNHDIILLKVAYEELLKIDAKNRFLHLDEMNSLAIETLKKYSSGAKLLYPFRRIDENINWYDSVIIRKINEEFTIEISKGAFSRFDITLMVTELHGTSNL